MPTGLEISGSVIGTIVFIALSVVIGIVLVRFITYYQDPYDLPDKFTKIVVWLVYFITTCVIIMLPMDMILRPMSNYFMPIVWQVFMLVEAILVSFLGPCTMCYYEHEGGTGKRCCKGVCYGVISIVIWAAVIVLIWTFVGYAEVPFHNSVGYPISTIDLETATDADLAALLKIFSSLNDVKVRATLPVYAVCVFSLVGWVMFLIFGFIGMFKLPFDCILACCFRPKRLSKNDYIEYKKKLTNKCNQVHDDIHLYKMVVSEKMVSKNPKERSLDRKQRKRLIDLQTQVDDIVNKYAQVEYVEKQDQYNVCIPILKLIAGIIFLIFAGLWFVQVLLVMVLDYGDFLSAAFIWLDRYVIFVGSVLYGCMVLYLALSVIEGSISIGTKFLLITFYPMKPHNTLPNAMLFNGILYALSSYALLQFSADAFQGFAHNTSVNGLFVNQMKNMSGIKYIFRYLNYVVLGFIVLGLIYGVTIDCCCFARRKRKYEKQRTETYRPIKAEMEDSPAVDGDINGPELEKLLQSDKATAIWMQDQCKAEQESMKTKELISSL
ncbi:putative LIMR family protein [Blattamonas nauphoetae]|uniref:LIMR family protein n=1 Tax=Blattamonas nauphoetae TaxID=2049346 RepID=A0ABQ9WNS2_9EUKA|nr:putative LIMR family protein [Blattamonas nauphoetae]